MSTQTEPPGIENLAGMGALQQVSTIVVIGTTLSGEEVKQEFQLTHNPGAPDAGLINETRKLIFEKIGGLFADSNDPSTIIFYPLPLAKIVFTVKKVVIAH